MNSTAAIFHQGQSQLSFGDIPIRPLKSGEVLIKVVACGLCRTDIHIIDSDLIPPKLPLVLGHEIVGYIADKHTDVQNFVVGDLVGAAWMAGSCMNCRFCLKANENLCLDAKFNGFHIDGGFSQYKISHCSFITKLPKYENIYELAPLLCAGLIGFRAISFIDQDAQNIGLYGFGAASHIAAQVLKYKKKNIYAFTKPKDTIKQNFARELGCIDAFDSDIISPQKLDAAIIFAWDGKLIEYALKSLNRGGQIILAGIHMTDIGPIAYKDLWHEKSIVSVSNLTRDNMSQFFDFISHNKIHSKVNLFNLNDINLAIDQMKKGQVTGAIVIKID